MPTPETIEEAVRRHARERADVPAFTDPARTLTWAQLDDAADRCAALLAGHAVGRGDRVAWLDPTRSVAHRTGADPGQVGSGTGFAEQLATDQVTSVEAGHHPLTQFGRRVVHQGRCHDVETHEKRFPRRKVELVEHCVEHGVVGRRQTQPTQVPRSARRRDTRIEERVAACACWRPSRRDRHAAPRPPRSGRSRRIRLVPRPTRPRAV